MPVKVSVIIVSYNSESFIEKCLMSLRASARQSIFRSEVIVLDSGSSDKTVDVIKKFSEIKLIESRENLGFSKGNNRAAKAASGEYLFFLNPDTEVLRQVRDGINVFDGLIKFYEEKDAGIIGPKLVMENGEVQPTVRKLPTAWGAFKEYILGIKDAYGQYVPETNSPLEVEMVYGAAMLIKKDLFKKVGGFNEKYFLYYEDADLCKRVREAGKKIYYYPNISINHLVGATKSQFNKELLNNQSLLKYHGFVGSFFLKIIFFIHRITNKVNK